MFHKTTLSVTDQHDAAMYQLDRPSAPLIEPRLRIYASQHCGFCLSPP